MFNDVEPLFTVIEPSFTDIEPLFIVGKYFILQHVILCHLYVQVNILSNKGMFSCHNEKIRDKIRNFARSSIDNVY